MVKSVDYTTLKPYERKFIREQYVIAQKNKCMWCKGSLDEVPPQKITDMWIDWRKFPKGFLTHPVHLQHDHKTGMTEGAVHAYCNAVMWQYHGR